MSRFTWLCSVVLVAVACGCSGSPASSSDDGGEPPDFIGLIGCDGGSQMVSNACALSIPLSGPLSGTFANFSNCGTSMRSLSWSDLGGSGVGIAITFMGTNAPVDQLGTFPLQSLDITQATAGGTLRWSAPPAACTVTIQGSICSPSGAFTNRRVIDGTGTCSEPAAPQFGNNEGPILIDDFKFVGFINPM